MAQAMEKKEHRRWRSPARSNSPERDHHSSHRRERSPDRRREKVPERSSDRERNRGEEEKLIEKEKDRSRNYERKEEHDRGRQRERERPIEKEQKSRNSERNREESMDESPRTRRLRRAQEERGAEKMEERESRKERRPDKEKNGREERENKRRRGSRSPERREKSGSRDEVQDGRGEAIRRSEDPDSLAKMDAAAQELEAKEKAKPSFELSGKLAEETNKVRGVALLYTEPAEARKTDVRWRLYFFKGGEVLNEPIQVHRQSCYLFGRERRVADIPTDHPSCSKQHAVLQYRLVEKTQPDGMTKEIVVPCVMDLESTNGTFINDNRIEARRYYELFEKDTIKFGNSSREYVLLHENSTT